MKVAYCNIISNHAERIRSLSQNHLLKDFCLRQIEDCLNESMAAIDKVKILVLGDSGVGKSTLVHLLSRNRPIVNPSWTIGCSVELKLHDYKEGTPMENTYFIELWDVGGSSNHRRSRAIFYNQVHGILLVHDLTNRKSKQNLRKWLVEVLSRGGNFKSKSSTEEYDPELFVDMQVPILVVGTKADLALEVFTNKSSTRTSSFAEECGADEIFLDCRQAKAMAPGSSNAVKLSRFFDKIIDNKYHSRDNNMAGSFLDRRKLCPTTTIKTLHND